MWWHTMPYVTLCQMKKSLTNWLIDWLIDWLACSVCHWRLPNVLLASPVLPRLVRRCHSGRPRDLWHYATHFRVVLWHRAYSQSDREQFRLDAHRPGVGRRHFASLLVRSETFRRDLLTGAKLLFHVAQIRFWSIWRTAWHHPTANTITHTRFLILR